MPNKEAICNQALALIGAQSITNFDDETLEAQACYRLYTQERDALLADHPWRFATFQAQLSQINGEPLLNYAYAYQVPGDLLRVLRVFSARDNVGGVAYQQVGDKLLADYSPLYIEYVRRVSEEGLTDSDFPPLVVKALVYHMAGALALAVKSDSSLSESMMDRAKKLTSDARLADSRGASVERWHPGQTRYIGVRGGGFGFYGANYRLGLGEL
jgi:hypothetical protein